MYDVICVVALLSDSPFVWSLVLSRGFPWFSPGIARLPTARDASGFHWVLPGLPNAYSILRFGGILPSFTLSSKLFTLGQSFHNGKEKYNFPT